MEIKKMERGVKKGDLRRELLDKIKTIPQEDSSNSMTTIKSSKKYFWRPNNYRRQIQVKEKSNSTIKKIKSAISAINFNFNKHTKILSIKNYHGITIQYGKHTLTGIYSQSIIGGVKEIYLIEAETIEDIQRRISEKQEEIKRKIDFALYKFRKEFKIIIPYKKATWSRYEDFIKGEDYIDKIPREVIIHDTYFKKVYGDGIEFKQTELKEEPTIHLKNYIKNRAIEDISPEINKEISNIHNTISGELNPILKEFTHQIELHLRVQKETLKTLKKMQKTMSQSSLKRWQ
jgi:hypothetical protein